MRNIIYSIFLVDFQAHISLLLNKFHQLFVRNFRTKIHKMYFSIILIIWWRIKRKRWLCFSVIRGKENIATQLPYCFYYFYYLLCWLRVFILVYTVYFLDDNRLSLPFKVLILKLLIRSVLFFINFFLINLLFF